MNRRLHFLQTVLHLPGRVPHILKRYGAFCRNKKVVLLKNKLRRYPQQPQRFIFTNLSEAFWWSQALETLSWPEPAPKIPKTFSETCTKASWNLFRKFLLNPVAPALALHQRTFSGTFFGNMLSLTWLCSKASHTFSGTFSGSFSGSLLKLTGLCTKASQTFSGTFSETLLNLTWLCTKASQAVSGTEPDFAPTLPGTFSGTFSGTLLNLTWLCTKASQAFSRNLLRNLVETDRLHRSLPDLLQNLPRNCWTWRASAPKFSEFFPELSPEPCWTWPGSAPKPPAPSPKPSPEPCWTWPSFAPKPPRPSPEPSPNPRWTWPGNAPKLPDLLQKLLRNPFRNLVTWLCTKASPEPSPEPCWTWLGFPPGFLEYSLEPCWTWPGFAPKPPRPSAEPSLEPSPEPCWSWLGSAPKPPTPSPDPCPQPCWTWPAPAAVHTGAILGWRPH